MVDAIIMRSFINNHFVLLLLVLCSCQSSKTANKIKSITVNFQPSFINHAKLILSRDNDSVIFIIDTSSPYAYQIANPILNTSKAKMETSTSIGSLWDSTFAKSLKNSNPGVMNLDGMGLFIEYVFEKGIDTIFLSNTYPKTTDQYFNEQIKYLETNTVNIQQKAYLQKLIRYI